VLQSYAPPYFKDTDAAIDAILKEKYGPSGLYTTPGTAAPSMKPEFEAAFIRESPHVEPEVVEVVRAICRYLWKTYRRFPAHCHAIDSAGTTSNTSASRIRRRRLRTRRRGMGETGGESLRGDVRSSRFRCAATRRRDDTTTRRHDKNEPISTCWLKK
jgi:hypothetical protein